jgi:hypothetical protein
MSDFAREAEFMYIPSIAEMEEFCFTRKYGSCKLFKDKEPKADTKSCKYTKPIIDLFISTGRYKEGSKSPTNKLLPR